MKPTHPVELLCCAIAIQEGWFLSDSTPRRKNNPGDLRFAGQPGATAPGWFSTGSLPAPIATFRDAHYGIMGLFRQVWLQVSRGETVRQIIETWAPPAENNTAEYLANVLTWTGLPADTPVLELLPALVDLRVSVAT